MPKEIAGFSKERVSELVESLDLANTTESWQIAEGCSMHDIPAKTDFYSLDSAFGCKS